MSRRKIAWIAVVAVVVIGGALVLLGHRQKAGAPGRPGASPAGRPGASGADRGPVPVTVVPVAERNVPVYMTANGTVRAHYKVAVVPQVGGQLLKLGFTEGQEVHKGQVLAQIDPRTYQAQYDQVLAKERQDQAQLASALSTLKRYQNLSDKHFVSGQDLENQRNTVRQLQATVQADQASVRDAKVKLDYTTVRAPIDGLTGIRQVDPGNVLSANSTSIVTLTQVHPIDVIFSLPGQDMDRVRRAQAKGALGVSAIDSTDSHVIADDGRLKVIDNEIDASTGKFQLKAVFPNKNSSMWPGDFVNVRLHVTTLDKAVVVPTEAVQRGPDGNFVYVVQPDKTVKMRPVTVAGDDGDTHSIIGKGLKVGERVVTEGQFRLKEGTKVNPLKPGEVPKAPTAEELKKAAQQGRGRRR
jgi:membrane fusion protein, multidrug efflux system